LELGLRVSFGFSGRTIWIADAHYNDGKRFIVHADEKLTAISGTGKGGLYPPID
jgi:hypothetical protein